MSLTSVMGRKKGGLLQRRETVAPVIPKRGTTVGQLVSQMLVG